MGGIVTPWDSEVLHRTWKRVGKGSGEWEMRNKKGRRNEESIELLEQNVTKFLTKSCMVAYEW